MSTRTTAILVCAFAALIPLGWPGLRFNMQPADLLFPIVAAALVLGRPALSSHRLDLLVVIYLAGSALSIPGSLSVRESSIALVKELYLAAVYLALRVAVPVGPRRICRWLVRGAAATAALSLAAAAVFYVTGHTALRFGEPMPLPYVGEVFRTRGTLEAPEFFGNLLTFVLPLALLFAMEAAEARWRASAVVALLASAELLTFSKSLGGCALAVTVLLWPRLLAHPWLKTAAVAATAGLIVAFNVAAIVTIRKADVRFAKDSNVPVPNYVYARQDDPAGADRVELGVTYNPMSYYLTKKVAWHAFLERPWTGIGNGAFHLEAERAFQEGRIHQAYRQVNAHSLPFGRLSETGIVGAVTLAAFLVVLWRSMLQTARLPGVDGRVGWALFAGVAGLLVNSINVDAMHFRFLWLAAGLTAGIGAANRERAPR